MIYGTCISIINLHIIIIISIIISPKHSLLYLQTINNVLWLTWNNLYIIKYQKQKLEDNSDGLEVINIITAPGSLQTGVWKAGKLIIIMISRILMIETTDKSIASISSCETKPKKSSKFYASRDHNVKENNDILPLKTTAITTVLSNAKNFLFLNARSVPLFKP